MKLRDQAKKRTGKSTSNRRLATKAKSRASAPKLDEPETSAPETVPPHQPNLPPPLPPALGFIASYARIPNLRKDRNSEP